jgi:guanylate kinase
MAVCGNLIIVSGPSGAGKSAISAGVLESVANIRFSVSHTTRPPRGSERDGIEYHFVSRERFAELRDAGEFLEWAEVYGNLYGTSRSFIEDTRRMGADVLLDVDVQGAKSIRQQCPDAVSVFILPPSYSVLRVRLERRQLDKDYVIEQRLRIACNEIRAYDEYDYLIVNDDLEKSVAELRAVALAARCRRSARAGAAAAVLGTFGGMNAEDSRKH